MLYNSVFSKIEMRRFLETFCACAFLVASFSSVFAQKQGGRTATPAIPTEKLLNIIRAEDERRWDQQVTFLLADKNAKIRARAALAAGRIGDESAVPALIDLLKKEAAFDVQRMAAFALGQIGSVQG